MKRGNLHPTGVRTARPPSRTDTLFMQGFSLHQKGCLNQAEEIYTQVVKQDPRHFDALHLLGVIAGGTRNPSRAVEWIGKAIQVNPGIAAAHSNLGAALKELGRFEEAVASFDRAISVAPNMAEAYSNRGNALREINRLEEAVASFDRAIALKPDYADAHSNRGNALSDLKRFDDALASYERALELKPDMVQAWSNRGLVLQKLRRLDDAVESYVRAIRLKPDFCDAYVNLGNALKGLNRLTEALAAYDLAIQVRPDQAKNWYNRAVVLSDLNRLDESLSGYDRAIGLNPGYSEALANSGHVLQQLNRFDEALARYDRVAVLKPDYEFLIGASIHVRLRICDWSDYDSLVGGERNYALGYLSVVAGGYGNSATEDDSVAGAVKIEKGFFEIEKGYSVAVAGEMNVAKGFMSMAAGGQNNTAAGSHSVTLGGGFSAARAHLSTAIGTGVSINETHHGAVAVAAYEPKIGTEEIPPGMDRYVTVFSAPDQQCKSTGPGSLTLCAQNNVTLTGKAVIVNGIDLLETLKQLQALKQQLADLQGAFDKQCGPASSGGRILTGCRSVVAETPQQPDRVPLIIGGAVGGALLLALTMLVALHLKKRRGQVAGGQVATSSA